MAHIMIGVWHKRIGVTTVAEGSGDVKWWCYILTNVQKIVCMDRLRRE